MSFRAKRQVGESLRVSREWLLVLRSLEYNCDELEWTIPASLRFADFLEESIKLQHERAIEKGMPSD